MKSIFGLDYLDLSGGEFAVFPSRHSEVSRDLFGCHNLGGPFGISWVESRVLVFYNAQDGPPQRLSDPEC